MNHELALRFALVAEVGLMLPLMAYHRIKAHTNEPLDRRQEGLFILATLRPIALAFIVGNFIGDRANSIRALVVIAASYPLYLFAKKLLRN